jgi:hypothetical protein
MLSTSDHFLPARTFSAAMFVQVVSLCPLINLNIAPLLRLQVINYNRINYSSVVFNTHHFGLILMLILFVLFWPSFFLNCTGLVI